MLPSLEVMDERSASTASQESHIVIYGSKMGEEGTDGGSERGGHCKKLGKTCGALGFICHAIECILNPIGQLVHIIVHAICDPLCGRKIVTAFLYILDLCMDPMDIASDAAELAGQAANGADACSAASKGNMKDAVKSGIEATGV